AEQALVESNRQLAETERLRGQFLANVKARDQFLSITSHELRTPLNPLQLHVQLLLRAAREGSLDRGPLSGRIVGMLEACERKIKQFTKLINELLDVSQMTAGQLQLQREDVDLAAVVRDVVERFQPELERAGCGVALRADLPVVGQWDRSRLDQVV